MNWMKVFCLDVLSYSADSAHAHGRRRCLPIAWEDSGEERVALTVVVTGCSCVSFLAGAVELVKGAQKRR